jgi:hypothetical protein
MSLGNGSRQISRFLVTALGATLVLTCFLPASAELVSVSPMVEFFDSGRIPASDDYSVVGRKAQWFDYEINTSGLDAGTAYTVWVVIFNHPQFCQSSPCGMTDLPIVPGHDPRVQASIMYGGGAYTEMDGAGRFQGRVYRTERGVNTVETLFGPGLFDPLRAEIHLVLRGHGPDPGDPLLAIGSYGAGCTAENPCGDHQASAHVPRIMASAPAQDEFEPTAQPSRSMLRLVPGTELER